MTKYVSETCPHCGEKKVTLDQHYGLPECFDFILLCPNHPASVFFDLSIEEIVSIAEQNDPSQYA